METYDIAVIGAGAAGMMSAAVAGQLGRRVVLVDHAPRLAEKIRISGGGRCNFTNLYAGPTTTCRRIRISRARRWRATRRATSSACSSAIT
jgi:predicted flavoprotein YhiN